MNESLAKQLHDLMKNYKVSIAEEIIQSSRKVNVDLESLEEDIKELIEINKKHQTNTLNNT